jgi:hypothetical protein
MKKYRWQLTLGISLLALSIIFYLLHYLLFRDAHHIFIYLVGDIAFVFIEVLMVTLIIHRLLEFREKKARLKKMNMVIGAFYSEVGSKLLGIISQCDPNIKAIHEAGEGQGISLEKKFGNISGFLKSHDHNINESMIDLQTLKDFLVEKRVFLLRLLENPILLEHESFSHLLWAVFHLTEELEARKCLNKLPGNDREHLSGDVSRVYGELTVQWLQYMEHLKKDYPFLFSLSVRKNPYDLNADPVICD